MSGEPVTVISENGKLREFDRNYIQGAVAIAHAILTRGQYDTEVLKVIRENEGSLRASQAAMREAGMSTDGLVDRLLQLDVPHTNGTDNGYIPLMVLVQQMGVAMKHRGPAVREIRNIIEFPDSPLKSSSIGVSRGYQIRPEEKVIEYLKPILENKGFFAGARQRHSDASSPAKEETPKPENIENFVSLTSLMQDMGVKTAGNRAALNYVGKLIAEDPEFLKGQYVARGKGYGINPSDEVRKILEPKLREQKLIVDKVPQAPRKIMSVEDIVSADQEQSQFVSLTRLASSMGIASTRLSGAVTYIAALLSKGVPEIEGSYLPRGVGGYTVKSTDQVKKALEPKLREAGFFSTAIPQRRYVPVSPTTVAVPAAVPRPVEQPVHKPVVHSYVLPESRKEEGRHLTLEETSGSTDPNSYDFTMREKGARISAAAIDEINTPRNLALLGRYGNDPLQRRISHLVQEAEKRGSVRYEGKGHELFTYSDNQTGLKIDFRMSHGTVTSITLRGNTL